MICLWKTTNVSFLVGFQSNSDKIPRSIKPLFIVIQPLMDVSKPFYYFVKICGKSSMDPSHPINLTTSSS